MNISAWPLRDELIALYTANTDMTVEEMADRLGISTYTVRRYAHELGIHRHPETIARQRAAIGERNKLINRLPDQGVLPAVAHWPEHRFEDDPSEHALSVWRRGKGLQVWAPIRAAIDCTLGGVASGLDSTAVIRPQRGAVG